MKKEIKEKETYEAPKMRGFSLKMRTSILTGSTTDYKEETEYWDSTK